MTNQTISFTEILKKAQLAKAQAEANLPASGTDVQSRHQSTFVAQTGQQKFYLDLCERTGTVALDPSKMKGFELYNAIELMKAMPVVASEAQKQKIVQLVTELTELGANIKPFSEKFLSKLTGGREGTASGLINTLYAKKTAYQDIAPPSENQIKTLTDWFWCPDIPYENYDVNKKVYFSDEDLVQKVKDGKPWRFMTKEEFSAELVSKLVRSQAKKIIATHQSDYYNWNKTRITKFQIETVRKIEKELADISKPKYVETVQMFDFDENGELIENFEQFKNSKVKDEWNVDGYDGLEESALRQMSSEEANLYIQALKAERDNKNLTTFPETNDQSQQRFQDKHSSFDKDRNRSGVTKDTLDGRQREYNSLDDLIYKLEAVAGQENEELHALIKESIIDDADNTEIQSQAVVALKGFMALTLSTKDHETLSKSIVQLQTMSQESLFASAVVEMLESEIVGLVEDGVELKDLLNHVA